MSAPVLPLAISLVFYILPVILASVAWHLWLHHYLRPKFFRAQEYVLLEIKLPKEILKTPAAMELALNALQQGWDGDDLITMYLNPGQARGWFTLELVSIGGSVRFYLWTQKFHQNIVEAQFYAQYPEIEIREVDDYVHDVPYGLPGSDWKLWGVEYKLAKEDAYPIKTYIDYGLDKPATDRESEATRVDPLTPILEFLGSIAPTEQIWIQIPVMAAKDRYHKAGTFFAREGWKDRGKALVKKLTEPKKTGAEDEFGLTMLSPGERKAVEAIERSLTKPAFDCGLRAVYLSKPETNNPNRYVALLGLFKQFNSNDLNGFKTSWTTGGKYVWDKYTITGGDKVAKLKAMIFDAYRSRSYFYPPYVGKPFVLSAEELATIYHFPGSVAATPNLSKIESKRAEPPGNLPV